MSTDTRKRYFVDEDDDLTQGGKLGRGAAAGGAIGGTLGALAAATATLSTGGAAAPLVAGPLAVTLLAGAAGVGAGSVIGTLASAGIPSEEAAQIDRGATEGVIVLAIDARPEDAARAREILSGGDARLSYATGSTLRRES